MEELMQEIDHEIQKEIPRSAQPAQNTQEQPKQTEAPLQENAKMPPSAPGDQKSQEAQNPGSQNTQKEPDQTKAPLQDAKIPSSAPIKEEPTQSLQSDANPQTGPDQAQVPLPPSAAGDQKSQLDPSMQAAVCTCGYDAPVHAIILCMIPITLFLCQVADQLAQALASLSIAPSPTQQTLQRPGTVDFSSLISVLQQAQVAQLSGSTGTTSVPQAQAAQSSVPVQLSKPDEQMPGGQQSKHDQQTNGKSETASQTPAPPLSDEELDDAEKQIQASP